LRNNIHPVKNVKGAFGDVVKIRWGIDCET